MDYNLDIVISEKDLSEAGINEIKFFWDGEEYSYTPKRFETEESLILTGFDIKDVYIAKNTDIDMPIVLNSSAVYDLQYTAYRCRDKFNSHNLMKFLKRVSGLEKFNIYLCGCDETTDYNIKYTRSPGISEIIYNTLIAEKNVMIYK